MIAPSYQVNYEIISEPFEENGKMYVTIKHKNTGNTRKAKYYTEKEYNKAYKSAAAPVKDLEIEKSISKAGQKDALGFKNGFITIFKGATYAYKEWFVEHKARYCKFWGWYIVSTDELPQTYPSQIIPITLKWETVGEPGKDYLKADKDVTAAVDAILYADSPSQFVGKPGDRKTFKLTVDRIIDSLGQYGHSYFHIMHDSDANVFTWSTSKSLIEGQEYNLKGTIKSLDTYHNVKQNALTRCVVC